MHEGGGVMIIPSSNLEGDNSRAKSIEAAPEGETPSPTSATGSSNTELSIIPYINTVTLPRRSEFAISPELA